MSRCVSQQFRDDDGNTKSSSRPATSLYWTFTFNNFTELDFDILRYELSLHCLDYRVQEEIGESGTPHLQGCIKAKKRIRPDEAFSNKKIHWEKTRSPVHARAYCSKEETATGRYILDTMDPVDLIIPNKPWQLEILDIISRKADYRSIYWYWEPDGNVGKSAFTKYLCAKKDALCVSGKSSDCKHAIASWYEKKCFYPKIILLDVPRTNIDYLSYEAIESIKNGCFFSGKYESGQVIMNNPHIFIFANSEPNTNTMSKDRWIIRRITNQTEIPDQTTHNSTLDV